MPPTAEEALNALVTLAVAPGIYGHETAHYAACRLLDIGVERPPSIGFFEGATFDHDPVETFWEDAVVAAAPLLGNSVLALGAFALAGALPRPWLWLPVWIGVSAGLTALPSGPDTATLLEGIGTLPRWRRPLGYAIAVPLRAVSASVVLAGPLALVWTVVLFRVTV
jgi:hypothetical protein